MNTNKTTINDLEDCLCAFGAEIPFNADGCFTEAGYNAYNKLIEVLYLMEKFEVVEHFNADMLDKIANTDY